MQMKVQENETKKTEKNSKNPRMHSLAKRKEAHTGEPHDNLSLEVELIRRTAEAVDNGRCNKHHQTAARNTKELLHKHK